MKFRPKVIVPSQDFVSSQHRLHNGCNGTAARNPSSTSSEDSFSKVCDINYSENNNHSWSSAANGPNSLSVGDSIGKAGKPTARYCQTKPMGKQIFCENSDHGAAPNHVTHRSSSNSSRTTKKRSDKTNHFYAYTLISLIAVIVYLNGINGDFVHDDIPAITLNKDVVGVNKITRLFFNDFWGTPMDDANSHKSYRPLTVLSFRLNYYLFGLKPFWFHFTNILMHAIVCVLFTRVCIIVAGLQDKFAIMAGIIFAVHPIHSEAVTGIVGRADILACIFFLISLLVYHGKAYSMNDTSTWLSILFGGISMLSKETGITVFLVNLTYDLYRCWPSLKRSLVDVHWTSESQQCYRRLTKLLISMGILLIVRLALLQGSFPKFSQQDNPTAYHPSFYVRMLTFCYLAAFNWWLVLCPSTLSHDWQMGSIPLLTSISDPRNLMTLWAFASTVFLLHRSLLDFEAQRYAPLILGVLLLILPFLPATNLFVTVGFVVAERVLYIPSLGCVLLVVYGAQIMWETMSKYRSFIILMGMLLITVGTCKTITRNRDWYSRECLLRAGLRTLPHNAKMHYNFGNFLKDSFEHDGAKLHYREALRLWPTYASAHNNLGTLVSNLDVAETHFLSAIMYASTHVNAHFNLGQLYLKKNRTNDAIRMLRRCIEIDATYVQAHLELVRLHSGHPAAVIMSNAIKANPTNVPLRLTFGQWLLNNGLAPAAVSTFQRVLEQNVSHKLAIAGICKSMRKMGQRSRLQLLISRLHTIERLARGGELHSIDIYLRNWSIRSELLKRAYLYSVENDSFHQPSVSAEPRQRNDSGSVSPHQLNITNGQQPADVKTYQNNSKDVNIRRDHERSASQPDLPYQKQYCNQLKTIPCDVMLADNVASPTEINTTARKTDQGDTIKIHCGKNEVMVNRCGTWSKNVRNCSERKAARDAKNAADMVATSTPMSVSEALKQKQYKMCPFNPLTTNKAPNLRTQNTFVSRLLLTDIFDNI